MAAAAASYRRPIELNPYTSKYYYRLATAEERLGLRDEAVAHRKRTKEINEARAQLTVAYAQYFATMEGNRTAATPDLATACQHLASICETMGWSRAAQAWKRLAVSS
jgi:tetratricopeptide (TPR) repeat protein